MASGFVWYELMTNDLEAARGFYEDVVGWASKDMGQAGNPYWLMGSGGADTAGLMAIPADAGSDGARPMWLGYIASDDIEASVEKVTAAGGSVKRPPTDIPGIGRFAALADPQGAMFMLLEPAPGDYPPTPPMSSPGRVGWHELYATDWEAAFAFYSSQFGWTKGDAMEMGPMGTYQLFKAGGADDVGGMMNKPAAFPRPFWGYYFNVTGIDAAADRVKAGGGAIMMGPHEVPGGTWVVQCTDPQGAAFALSSPVK